jgi:hypothetical protein
MELVIPRTSSPEWVRPFTTLKTDYDLRATFLDRGTEARVEVEVAPGLRVAPVCAAAALGREKIALAGCGSVGRRI